MTPYSIRGFLPGATKVASNIRFDGPEGRQSVSNAQPKRVRVKFMKLDARFPERRAEACGIQLEICQRFVRVRVFLQLHLWDWFEKCHYGWATYHDNRLLFRRDRRDSESAQNKIGDRGHQLFHIEKVR
jgi:hypothetical protein